MEATGVNTRYIFIDYNRYGTRTGQGMEKIREIFSRYVQPVYGDQEMALQKIEDAKDRLCFFLIDHQFKLKGVLVYKTILSNEYQELGVTNSLEIKTVLVLDSEEEVAARLIKKIKKVANKLQATSLHATTNKQNNFSLESFQRHGFVEITVWPHREPEEHLLKLTLRNFHIVKADSKEMEDLRKIFEEILLPLYGSQEEALKKIALGEDRVCYLLYEQVSPVGVIAFKTILSNEFQSNGVRNSIEIKSLFVVESSKNSGRGIGSVLFDKVTKEVNKMKIPYESIHVTVSETKMESLNFFKRKGFRIVTEWKGKYIKGVTEYLLSRLRESSKAQAEEKSRFEQKIQEEINLDVENKQQKDLRREAIRNVRLVRVEVNAHWDDIHVLKRLCDGTYISGSKDTTLRKWDQNGDLLREVLDIEPVDWEQKEKEWITAATVLNDEYWVSGDRRGLVRLWTTRGDFVRNLLVKKPGKRHVSMPYNKRRITCMAAGLNKFNPSFFVGFPTMFVEYSLTEGKTVSLTTVHNNDWVFCIHPLSPERNLVVTAGKLEVWKKASRAWEHEALLFSEKRKSGGQRCFISGLTPLESSPNVIGMALFGGYVNVMDIRTSQVIREWREHKGRTWAIENLSREVFASSGEDGLIKLWDARYQRSVCSIGNHTGGVCAMLKLEENVLVAGACPPNPASSNTGAQLLTYDFRS